MGGKYRLCRRARNKENLVNPIKSLNRKEKFNSSNSNYIFTWLTYKQFLKRACLGAAEFG